MKLNRSERFDIVGKESEFVILEGDLIKELGAGEDGS